jgi:hypothetical protein
MSTLPPRSDRKGPPARPLPLTEGQPLLYTRRQAARLLGVSEGYVYGVAVRGELACVELPSRGGRRRGRMMFRPADLEEFITRHRKERRS